MLPGHLLPTTATWLQPGEDVDAYGDVVDDWPTTGTTITCRLEQASADETVNTGRDTATARLRLFTNETRITARDRLVVDGVHYELVAPPALVRGATSVSHLEALVRVIDPHVPAAS